MIGMVERSTRTTGRLRLPLLLGLPVFVFALDFVSLLATYLVLARIAPGPMGEVAVSPARFAAWIALVQLPMALAHLLAVSWRGWLARGEVHDPPRRALVRARDWVLHATWAVVAALIVFGSVADPGDAHLGWLVAVTAVVPLLLPRAVSGSARLLRWWWRRRHPPRETAATSAEPSMTAVPHD
jgi:hypothetical protein